MLISRLRIGGVVLVMVLGLMLDTSSPGGEKGEDDKDCIQGVWRVVSLQMAGKKAPEKEYAAMKLCFVGDEIFAIGDEDGGRGTYRLNPKAQPSEIDVFPEPKRNETRGTYQLEADKLILCFLQGATDKRPTNFKPEDTANVVMVLERVKGEKIDLAKLREIAKKGGSKTDRVMSQNNLKQIGIAFHNYHDARKHFPTQAICDEDGKPLLSWRVAILPYLEGDRSYDRLYQRFKLDEPWDSPHNIKLLDKIPEVYKPVANIKVKEGSTFYQVFTGPQTMFTKPTDKVRLPLADGASNTILVVEAGTAVPWTKPEDMPYEPKKKLPMLGLSADGFNVCLADGRVRFISRQIDEATVRALITAAGGEPISEDKLDPPKKAP